MFRLKGFRACVACLVLLSLQAPAAPSETAQRAVISREVPSLLEKSPTSRYLVLLRDRADLTVPSRMTNRDARRRAVVDALRTTAMRSQRGILRLLDADRSTGEVLAVRPFWLVNAVVVESSEEILHALASRPEVAAILSDREFSIGRPQEAHASGAAGAGTPEWNIDRIGAPDAWRLGIDGSGLVIGSLDTGIDPTHPSLASKYRGAHWGHDYNWWDATGREPAPYDPDGHGTITSGVLLGGDAGGPDPDDIGVAPGATWVAAKVYTNKGRTRFSRLLEGAQFLTAPTRLDGTDPRPGLAPDVINGEYASSFTRCRSLYDDMLTAWRAMGIFPAFAAGNGGPAPGTVDAPGDSVLAFSVGATDQADQVAPFSGRGPSCTGRTEPDISAPGVGVRSSVRGGGFGLFSGTSMAVPHVAGAAALLLQASAGGLTVQELESLLARTAVDLGTRGPDNDYGAGRLAIGDAVRQVLRGGTLAGTVTDGAGRPVAGAEVTGSGPGGTSFHAVTRADGTYRVRVAEGTWTVRAKAFWFLDAAGGATVVSGGSSTLDLALEAAPRSTVSGVVREAPSGAPLAGATVAVLKTPISPVTTDASGRFTFEVPRGTYQFEAARGRCRARVRTPVDATTDTSADFSLERLLDAGGYRCEEVPFAYERGATQVVGQGSLPGGGTSVALPFEFPFYGTRYSTVWLHGYGYVSFVSTSTRYVNRPVPDRARPNGAVYAYWDWLQVGRPDGGIYTATFGEAPRRRFVIEYRWFEQADIQTDLNFEVVLGEEGWMELRYADLRPGGRGQEATLGLENPVGTGGFQYSFNERAFSDETAVRYEVGDVGFLTGIVSSAADGLPVDDALVAAGGRSVRTGPDGTYRLAMPPGQYVVEASAAGYGPASAAVSVGLRETAAVDFSLPAPRAQLEPTTLEISAKDTPVSRSVALSNGGQLALTFETRERPIGRLELLALDALGDAVGSVDVTGASGAVDDSHATIVLAFSEATPMDQVVGTVLLDTDRNASTGRPVPYLLPAGTTQDVGYEYYLQIDALQRVRVYDQDDQSVGSAASQKDGTSLRIDVPLAQLGNDDGQMDLVGMVSDYSGLGDWIPEAGHMSMGLPSDVTWLRVAPTQGELAPGATSNVIVDTDPNGLAAGLHQAQILFLTNDPRRPVQWVTVTLRILDDVPPDDVPPASAFSTRDGAVLVRLAGQTVAGSSRDDASGVDQVLVTFTPLVGSPATLRATLTCDQADRRVCNWTSSLPPLPGRYEVNARAVDVSGNVESPGPTISVLVV